MKWCLYADQCWLGSNFLFVVESVTEREAIFLKHCISYDLRFQKIARGGGWGQKLKSCQNTIIVALNFQLNSLYPEPHNNKKKGNFFGEDNVMCISNDESRSHKDNVTLGQSHRLFTILVVYKV